LSLQRGVVEIGRFGDGRLIYRLDSDLPPMGYIAIGVIDRGTNVIQARPTTICPQNCIFCSVDAGLKSVHRWAEYIAEPGLITRGVESVLKNKGCSVEVLLDTIGDVLTYPWLVELIKELRSINGVKSIALETHGLLLSEKLVDKLHEAGLDRVNLSIETLNQDKARFLYGTPAYSVDRVLKVAEYLAKETSIDLHVTPLWLPGLNDEDLVRVIDWAIRVGAGKKWPPVTIQKFIRHKYGRGLWIREVSWSDFWSFIDELEKKTGVRLKWSMYEWGMHYARRIKPKYSRGDIVEVDVIARGWLRGEFLGVINGEYLIGVRGWRGLRVDIGGRYIARIVGDKDGLLLGLLEKTIS